MDNSVTDTAVEIDGVFYSLKEIPDENSAVVLAEKEHLYGSFDLKTLVTDLGRAGRFIRVAYNGVGAAGWKFTDQQNKMHRLGRDIAKLCAKSADTVYCFKKASESVLTDLKTTYTFLLDNMETNAVITLSNVSDVANNMREAALALKADFENEEEKVNAVLESTQREKGKQAENIQNKKYERTELEEARKREEQLIEEKIAKEKQAELRRKKLELREDKEVARIGKMHFIKELVNVFTIVKCGTKVFSTDGPEKRTEAIRKQRLVALKEEQAIQEQRYASITRMSEFTAQIKQCKTEENIADCAVGALHHAAGALKQLSVVMFKAAQFWQRMQEHCKSLAEPKVKSQVEAALTSSTVECRKTWRSNPFKSLAIKFYAEWVALHKVCTVYMEQIKETQKELYSYLEENPTWEQSRQSIKDMAANFLSDLQKDQKAICEKKFQTQEEIEDLTEA